MCHDHDVLVDEVVRRNRWRIALLTLVAIVNYREAERRTRGFLRVQLAGAGAQPSMRPRTYAA